MSTAETEQKAAAVALGDAILHVYGTSDDGLRARQDFDASIGFFWKADHSRSTRTDAAARPATSRAAKWCSQASPTSWSTHLTRRAGPRCGTGPRGERAGIDQGRSAGTALRARQRRHQPLRTDLMARLNTTRPLVPLRTHPRQAVPAGTATPADLASCSGCAWRSPRAGGGGVVRRGARRPVGAVAGAARTTWSRSRTAARKQRLSRRAGPGSPPGAKVGQFAPIPTLWASARFLNRYFTVTGKSRF